MGLFGGGGPKPVKNPLSLIVNQDMREAPRPPWLNGYWRLGLMVFVVLVAGSAAVAVSQSIDALGKESRDADLGKELPGVPIEQVSFRYVVDFRYVSTGGTEYGFDVEAKEPTADLIPVDRGAEYPAEASHLALTQDSSKHCRTGDKCWAFPHSWTVFFPNGMQTPTRHADFFISNDRTAEVTATLEFDQQGEGEYVIEATYLDGEVVWCGDFPTFKCWEYEEHQWEGSHNVSEDDGWF